MSMDTRCDPRVYLKDEVDKRAKHRSVGDVRDTYSFANADRIFGQEYHGRFLIELLQNAADASRELGSSRVAIRVAADGRALLVANEGDPMTAKVVIESLGQIGQSTKEKGEAIGHKGIGFKSVLELSLTPEIYSGLRDSSPMLSVGFDPEEAREMIRKASHDDWEEWDKEVRGSDDPLAAIPALRFPYWKDELPPDVAELGREFDTVVRLPFDERFAERLKLDEKGWLEAVRKSLRDVSDRIFLLLGRFDEVRIEDRHTGAEEIIKREWHEKPVAIGGGAKREVVRVMRNGRLSSQWRLFRRRLEDRPDLEEIAVGVRIGDETDATSVRSATDEGASAPFHLFFPTKIQSGLPFLLHAYFEVNAARTGFYDGPQSPNKRMRDELAALVKIAVEDIVESEDLDLASLVNLVAEAGEPGDDDARNFRSDVLRLLDGVAWIPLKDGHEEPRSASPEHVFAERGDIVGRIGDAFPEPYIERRSALRLPDAKLGEHALELVRSRPSDASGLWDFVGRLCRPGEDSPWDDASADGRFLRLIELFKVLDAVSPEETKGLLDGLRGDSESRIIPAVGDGGGRRLLPVPDPTPGRRGRIVMSRRSSSGRDLVPPDDLDISFLHDGLLSSEPEEDGAKPLGVRPFTVDTVLDRIGGVEASEGNEDALVRFLWKFLAGERRSAFGTRQSADRAVTFDPSEWFWCDPGTIWKDEAARARQRRIRNLSSIPLPCRDGKWRRAGRIAFGEDWAEWLKGISGENHSEAMEKRIAAYRAMEKLSPGSEHLLARPDEVLPLLDVEVFENMPSEADDGEFGEAEVELDEGRRNAERHAFLLRLGVWEVPPIEAYESRDPRDRSQFPWTGKIADKQRESIEKNGGWRFGHGWENRAHGDVYVAEDHRFLWPLEEMARRDGSDLVECLRLGAELYRKRANALVFCPWCSDAGGRHTSWRRSNEGDEFPSLLATELRSEPWIPCTLDGKGAEVLMEPESAWWNPEPPSENALKQSPWRFVPHCGPGHGVDENLRHLAKLNTFEEAPTDAVERLLLDLRGRFEGGRISRGTLSSSVARQAFIGVHRMAYERLAKFASDGVEVKEIVERTLVLCEVGENLEYRMPGDARHDDGRFASYTRRFDGKVPFIVLRKDRGMVADALGVARFGLKLARKGNGEGRDVTEEVRDIHLDRIPELLAIVAHHSLGAQTLEPSGKEFETRATRLGNLRIKQLDDLVVVAEAEGFEDVRVEIGAGSNRDLFLDNSTPSEPILFHDFSGTNWREHLRQKISPHFAAILESPAYAHTFMAFLQSDGDGRVEFLHHDLGISESDVEAIAKRIGAAR